MILRTLKKLSHLTLLIIGLILLVISFAPFLFIKELPSGNKGQLQGLFSMIWTVFTMIPAILFTAAGFIFSINKLIQSKFKLNSILSIGISAFILSRSSLLLEVFIPSKNNSSLDSIFQLVFGFFEFFLFYPSIIAIIIGVIVTIIKRKSNN